MLYGMFLQIFGVCFCFAFLNNAVGNYYLHRDEIAQEGDCVCVHCVCALCVCALCVCVHCVCVCIVCACALCVCVHCVCVCIVCGLCVCLSSSITFKFVGHFALS